MINQYNSKRHTTSPLSLLPPQAPLSSALPPLSSAAPPPLPPAPSLSTSPQHPPPPSAPPPTIESSPSNNIITTPLLQVHPIPNHDEPSTTIEPTSEILPTHLNAPTDDSQQSQFPPTQQPQETTYRSLLYIPKLTDRLIKCFKKDYPHLTIATRLNSTVSRHHSHVKDPKNKLDNNNIIYKIPCKDCHSSYIGMTTNRLKTRLSGHASHINKLTKILEDDTHTNTQLEELREKTALIEHCIDTDHRFNLEKTCIIDRATHTKNLPFWRCVIFTVHRIQ